MRKILWMLPLLLILVSTAYARDLYDAEVEAFDKYGRTAVANTGVSIVEVHKDHVRILATRSQLEELAKAGFKVTIVDLLDEFPPADQDYHDYAETNEVLGQLADDHPEIVSLFSIGQSIEGREIFGVKISDSPGEAEDEPGVLFVGAHHAREHLSVEVPLAFAEHFAGEYENDILIRQLVDANEIYIVPMLNPDGCEYDILGGSYHMWRKNRRNNGDGTYGVDPNRNYSKFWGGPGSSGYTGDETYRGPSAFSEPETAALRDFVDDAGNIMVLVSYHSYGELIMYPWNGDYDPIPDADDLAVHEIIAAEMADMTGYTDQQGSDLYLSSGDTTDWAYSEYGIFAFTVELYPVYNPPGFYPDDEVIDDVVADHIPTAEYLVDLADDPYKLLRQLRISPDSATLDEGETLLFTASGGTPPYRFEVDDDNVGSITDAGLFTALAEGTCHVTVYDSMNDSATTDAIRVEEPGLCALAIGDGPGSAAGALALLGAAWGALWALRRRFGAA